MFEPLAKYKIPIKTKAINKFQQLQSKEINT